MVTLLTGKKGSGKTKKLIQLANEAVAASSGNVVVIEKGSKLTYDVTHKARLIDTDHYEVSGYDMLFGFLSGICAGNYDVTDVFVDATLRIVGRDYEKLADFFDRVSALSGETNTNYVFTVSCDEEDLPAHIFEIAEKY